MTTSYKGTFVSCEAFDVHGDVEIKDKTTSSALGILTYRGTFKNGQTMQFRFTVASSGSSDKTGVRKNVMYATLASGQSWTFRGKEIQGVIDGSYSSNNPGDVGTFHLSLV